MKWMPIEVREQHDTMGNAPHLLCDEDRVKIDACDFSRAGGECVCSCGKRYWQHPLVVGALWLNKLCDGSLVHL
jgi:hypothetical protein